MKNELKFWQYLRPPDALYWILSKLWTVLVGLFVFPSAAAWSESWAPTYGGEFEITTPEVISDWKNYPGDPASQWRLRYDGREKQMQFKFARLVREKCKTIRGCQIQMSRLKSGRLNNFIYTISFADGFWIRLDVDPSCIEIQFRKSTLQQLYQVRDRMNQLIFKTAEDNGFIIDREFLSGHFNIGTESAFADSGRALLSFVADYSSFPELAMGVLGKNYLAAPPLMALPLKSRLEFQKLLRLARSEQNIDIRTVGRQINEQAYGTGEGSLTDLIHDQAINLETIASEVEEPVESQRVELRAIFAQESFDQFILLAELFELRMKHLKSSGFPLNYKFTGNLNAKPSDRQLVNAFYRYITEAGGDYERFRPLLLPRLRQLASPVEIQSNYCGSLLSPR